MRQPDDFMIRKPKDEDVADEAAEFAFFGPPHAEERFRFLILRENGDDISLLPGEGRFKKGLSAWRWSEAKGGDHERYMVQKTKHNRIDLRRMPK